MSPIEVLNVYITSMKLINNSHHTCKKNAKFNSTHHYSRVMLSLRCLEGFQIKHFKNLVCLLNFFPCVCLNWIWSLFLQIMGIVPFTTGDSIGICTSLQILCWEITTTPTANNVERRVPEIRHDPVLVSTKIYSKVRFSWQFFIPV